MEEFRIELERYIDYYNSKKIKWKSGGCCINGVLPVK
ncbi:MAG: hypothetical protein HFI78_10655 [Lachnospiraceae bacterium]|nr:hypothetical protein [Lachnospiraceae bacterium]